MRVPSCLVLAALACLAAPAQAVVLGTPTRDSNGLRRAVVALENSAGELCSGTLIAQDLVLTAAHCVMDEASYRVVSVDRGFRKRAVNVVAMSVHPTFKGGSTPRTQPGVDLAIMKLEHPLGPEFTPYDPQQAARLDDDERVTMAGFGLLSEKSAGSARVLREAFLVARGVVEAANVVKIAVDPQRGGETRGAGACHGDSGGPILTGPPARYRLSGIISWSSGPLRPSGPSLCGGMTAITPLADHLGWLKSATRQLSGPEGAWTRR